MAVEFQMPKLGLTMEEGTIVEWLVADGANVSEGAPVLSIETDKVESEVEASGSGLLHIVGAEGETYACGELIAWFLEPGEEAPAAASPAASRAGSAGRLAPTGTLAPTTGPAVSAGDRILASPNARRVAAERGVDLSRVAGTGPGGRIVSEDVPAHPVGGGRPAATAAARQVAPRLGVDLGEVRSHGPDVRVNREDVERHARERLRSGSRDTLGAGAPLAQDPSATVPMAGMRGTIAERMHASLRDMAQLTLTMEVVMDAVVQHRSAADSDGRPGYTDYVLSAIAAALTDHPVVNSQMTDGHLALLPAINVGLAVALENGLVVPVVKNADTLSLAQLSGETTRLATAARAGELSPADVEGGTISVTALGMFGVDAFTPVINPPNTAIVGVGRIRDATRWDGDRPVRTRTLTLSLTWDHRAFDGAPAAAFAAAVRDRLEGWETAE